MDGRPNPRNKAAFLNFSGVVWRGAEHVAIYYVSILMQAACFSKHDSFSFICQS